MFEIQFERAGLAFLSRIMRKQERKIKNNARYLKKRHPSGYFKHQEGRPKPEPIAFKEIENADQLAEEAYNKFWNFHNQTSVEVRREARILHLAYGFLRGTPYSKMEGKTHNNLRFFEKKEKGTEGEPDSIHGFLRQVWHAARRHSEIDIRDLRQAWSTWVDECREHLLTQEESKIPKQPEQSAEVAS